ncbi:hypothetical protein [Sinisalibacter aestuarii]|uniref:DUF8173 domain-containing protein n=1 Tax=Sinisalibacter aestuarii TaxID=2949426 RepID=A0ABQ5LPS3_9RHOB|nr:hypothetical protein [Sinisalibacter aestuarii]GKY87004.1 hypothetical protein STA1M1_08730 [Sinisalibacter aestuarii]
MRRILLPILLIVLAAPALAQDAADWRFGGDAYLAGRNVTLAGDAVQDLFIAGDKVTARADIEGTAHMAGRYVTLESRVGQNFYGVGMAVEVDGTVAGNVTAAGDSVIVSEPVSGNLRATGSSVDITAPVAGNAILGGEHVTLDATVGGDLALAAANVDWGDGARVAGEVHIYADDPSSIEVPSSVAGSDRVILHEMGEWDDVDGMPSVDRPGFFQRLTGWLGGVLVVGVLGTIFAAVAPGYLAGLRERALSRPLRTGAVGFVGLSALVGSVVFLAMTGIGIVLVPVSIIAAVLLGILGYVIGAYAIGVWAFGMAGRGMPDSTGDRAIAAFAGAAIGALIGLIPWLGWLAVMAIFLVGAGALVARIMKLGVADMA